MRALKLCSSSKYLHTKAKKHTIYFASRNEYLIVWLFSAFHLPPTFRMKANTILAKFQHSSASCHFSRSTRKVINNKVPYYIIIHSETLSRWVFTTKIISKRIKLTLKAVASHFWNSRLFLFFFYLAVAIHLTPSQSFQIERHRVQYFSRLVNTFGGGACVAVAVAPLTRASKTINWMK